MSTTWKMTDSNTCVEKKSINLAHGQSVKWFNMSDLNTRIFSVIGRWKQANSKQSLGFNRVRIHSNNSCQTDVMMHALFVVSTKCKTDYLSCGTEDEVL